MDTADSFCTSTSSFLSCTSSTSFVLSLLSPALSHTGHQCLEYTGKHSHLHIVNIICFIITVTCLISHWASMSRIYRQAFSPAHRRHHLFYHIITCLTSHWTTMSRMHRQAFAPAHCQHHHHNHLPRLRLDFNVKNTQVSILTCTSSTSPLLSASLPASSHTGHQCLEYTGKHSNLHIVNIICFIITVPCLVSHWTSMSRIHR